MRNTAIIILVSLVLISQSCQCSLGWGYSGIKGGYFPQSSWSDTSRYYEIMQNIGKDHPGLKLDSEDVKINLSRRILANKADSFLLNPASWYPSIDCPFGELSEFCRHSWYIKSKQGDLIFKVGLYADGFGISHVRLIANGKFANSVGAYELCDMDRKSRNRLRKEYIRRFENEFLPLMKPYFNPLSSKK